MNSNKLLAIAQKYAQDLVAGASDLADTVKTAVSDYINTSTDLVTDENVGGKINDYLTKDNSVSSAIVNTVSGQAIYVNDASDKRLKGLSIYGRTTQDGTPSIDTPVELVGIGNGCTVQITGKNILQDIVMLGRYSNGIFSVASMDEITLPFLPISEASGVARIARCNKGETYTFSITNPNENHCIGITEYSNLDSISSITNAIGYVKVTANTKISYTALGNGYLVCGLAGKWTDGSTTIHECTESELLQLEIGDSATEYEKYVGKTESFDFGTAINGIPVDSGGNYTDVNGQQWTCDEIDFERGVYVQRVKKIKLTKATDFNTSEHFGSITANDILQTGGRVKVLSDRFIFSASAKTDGIAFAYANIIRFYRTCESVEDFNEWLTEVNGVDIMYLLATPIETQLSDEQMTAFKALYSNMPHTTVLSSEGADMTVKYVADTKTYIDNKFTELAKAIVATAE
ncbi:MAG: hypothetical protein E7290_09305 [Lachnospiraceae bacterium]|nr:hypothetical protein [Lachnospiraceae bacterium]